MTGTGSSRRSSPKLALVARSLCLRSRVPISAEVCRSRRRTSGTCGHGGGSITDRPESRIARHGRLIVRVLVVAAAAIVVGRVGAGLPILQDFLEYWAAGRLNLDGVNPYDPEPLLALEQSVRPDQSSVIMMWNPPWTLALAMPFAALPYATARWVWLAVQFAVLVGSTQWLWQAAGGRERGAWVASLLCLAFPPTFYALAMGQISPVLVLGLCGFLYCERRGWDVRAGTFAALTLIKPHWLLLFWLALAGWVVASRRWRVLAGAATALAVATGLAWLPNPDVLTGYLTALREYPPDYWVAPSAGVLSRVLLGWELAWPQFLPAGLGALWLAWFAYRWRGQWDWFRTLPAILFASVLTAAYGWSFDQVVFVLPLVVMLLALVRERRWRAWAGLAVFVAGSLLLVRLWPHPVFVVPAEPRVDLLNRILSEPNMFWHISVAPILALGYALALWGTGRASAGAPIPVEDVAHTGLKPRP